MSERKSIIEMDVHGTRLTVDAGADIHTLAHALGNAQRVSNDELTALVARVDAAAGGRVGEEDRDMDRDPDDAEPDPLGDGLATLTAGVSLAHSPPSKRTKEGADPADVHPNTRLTDLARSLGLDVRSAEFAAALDARDPLASFRSSFHLPKRPDTERDGLYFEGNSLGLMPKAARARVEEELHAWETKGGVAHFEGARPWAHADDYVRAQIARVVGALEPEVVVMNGLTTNLHLMLVPFYRPTATRYRILTEKQAFPSDRYAVETHVRMHNLDPADAVVEVGPRAGEATIRTEDIVAAITRLGDSLACVVFSGVHYYSGQFFDMAAITAAGHAVGALVGFDLAHAAGNVVLRLHDWNVDWGVWCSYKYLNSGPGGIAGAFVHQRHHGNKELCRLGGWWGQVWSTRFDMLQPWDPIPDAYGFRLSNPPILQIAAHLAALELHDRAGMPALRAKSELLTGYLELLLQRMMDPGVVEVITPADHRARGCQLSLFWHLDVEAVFALLHKRGVFLDIRKPNVTRVAPVPLYNTFADVHELVVILGEIVDALVTAKK